MEAVTTKGSTSTTPFVVLPLPNFHSSLPPSSSSTPPKVSASLFGSTTCSAGFWNVGVFVRGGFDWSPIGPVSGELWMCLMGRTGVVFEGFRGVWFVKIGFLSWWMGDWDVDRLGWDGGFWMFEHGIVAIGGGICGVFFLFYSMVLTMNCRGSL